MKDKDRFLKNSFSLPEDIKEMLRKVAKKSSSMTKEQFLAEVMIGKCPQCGSEQTKSCEDVDGIEDFTIGLCMICGYLWCSECGRKLVKNVQCNHWDVCRQCDERDESGCCDRDLMDCRKLNDG